MSRYSHKCSIWTGLLSCLAAVASFHAAEAQNRSHDRVRPTHYTAPAAPITHATVGHSSASGHAVPTAAGYIQLVRFEAPEGATIELATSSGVMQLAAPAEIGLLVGPTYRLRISYLSDRGERTLYPTVRLIGYTMPPPNVSPSSFPVPVMFIERDFEEAMEGRYVSNVMFLEDPLSALPVAFPKGELPVLDTGPGEDVLFRASELGRPIVLIQMGNRVPLDGNFESMPNDPPIHHFPAMHVAAPMVEPPAGIQQAGWQQVAPAAAGSMVGALRPSAPACRSCLPISRMPYKTHPRMPHDEYLCDGGDDVPYAHLDAHNAVVGLGASESAAVFTRPGEGTRLTTSNKVCIYSPRFGLIRSSSLPVSGLHAEGARGVDHRLRRGSLETRTTADLRKQKEQTLALRRREHLGKVAMNEPLGAIDELRVIDAVHQRDGSTLTAGQLAPKKLGQADEARIALGIQAAIAWNRVQYPAFTAIIEGGGQVTGYARTGEVQQIKEPDRQPGDLQLIKCATPDHAQQGDTIEFVIYYRNIGEQPLQSISIIDSLTARLEYVPNSARTDRRAVFTASPNDVESHELRWDILDPLPGGQGGVVWFQAKVR